MRGEAAVKGRFSKEAGKKNAATVIPCEKHMFPAPAVHTKRDHHSAEDMLQQVYKGGLVFILTHVSSNMMTEFNNRCHECPGGLRWKQVSIYINNKSQVNFINFIYTKSKATLFQFLINI